MVPAGDFGATNWGEAAYAERATGKLGGSLSESSVMKIIDEVPASEAIASSALANDISPIDIKHATAAVAEALPNEASAREASAREVGQAVCVVRLKSMFQHPKKSRLAMTSTAVGVEMFRASVLDIGQAGEVTAIEIFGMIRKVGPSYRRLALAMLALVQSVGNWVELR